MEPDFEVAIGRGADGVGGLLPAFGLAATGGGPGFVLAAIGGGTLPAVELCGVFDGVAVVFFHGVAEPLEGAIPGNTETGLADTSAATDVNLVAGVDEGLGASGAGRRRGGGGGAGADLGFGGTNSR